MLYIILSSFRTTANQIRFHACLYTLYQHIAISLARFACALAQLGARLTIRLCAKRKNGTVSVLSRAAFQETKRNCSLFPKFVGLSTSKRIMNGHMIC